MKTLEINPTNEYHILRHFTDVSADYIKSLIGKEYYYFNNEHRHFHQGVIDAIAITEALETVGSKFTKNVKGIENPRELLNLMKVKFESYAEAEIEWKVKDEYRFFPFLLTHSEAVGFKNLVPIDGLTAEQKDRVKTMPRSAHAGEDTVMVKVVADVEMQPTNSIVAGVFDYEDLPFYQATAYPGDVMFTPDFPNASQSEEEYAASKHYWETHVFIV